MSEQCACPWPGDDLEYRRYHDEEWGRAGFDSQQLFAKLCLDGQQAGLSWLTILRKQKNFEAAFVNFNAEIISQWGDAEIDTLMQNTGIIRSRAKIKAIIGNAQAYLLIEKGNGEFSDWLWSFVNHQQIDNQLQSMSEMLTQSPESEAMAKALKKAGFKFVGPTICYAFMQAVGMINDHLISCKQHHNCIFP